jgi:hypothetical protein
MFAGNGGEDVARAVVTANGDTANKTRLTGKAASEMVKMRFITRTDRL